MPLTVGRVENLFWANNSYKKPNCAPVFAESQEINQRPIIYGFMGGRTHLYGDQWNYAIYKGIYYFLQIEECKDLEKKHYTYALIRDMWVNMIINHSVEVNGFLSTTNRDEWLEANLNRTYPVLVQPCDVTRLSLVEAKQKLSEATVIKSRHPLPMILFDIRELREIKSHWNVAVRKYKSQVDQDRYVKGNSPIFIFAELKGKRVDSVHSWKEYLRVKINELLNDLGNEDLVISKVQNTEAAGRLKDRYCITWKNGGIGVGEENVIIDTIDLEGLEDIVFINPKTLEEGDPLKSINESVFENISFPSGYESPLNKDASELKVQKVRRKIYFPLTQDPNLYGVSLPKQYKYGNYWDNELIKDWVNWNAISPQRVKLKATGIGEIFLLWADNIDFNLSYHKHAYSELDSGSQFGGYKEWIITSKDYKEAFGSRWGINKYPSDFKVPYPFLGYGDGYEYKHWFFNHKYITPFGFLIFKPFNAQYLDGYVWTGTSTSKLHYISGLRKSRLEKVENGEVFNEIGGLHPLPYMIWTYYDRENRDLNNDNWNRYWFNITNGLDIMLQPNQYGYTYATRTWRKNDRTSGDYTYRYLIHDRAPWLNNKAPFYSAERHRASINRSRRLVDWIIMKTLMELPVILNTGDYLFNDMEYWVDEYDTTLWTNLGPLWMMRGLGLLEDYVKAPKQIDEADTNSVVICSTREGDVEIRECIRFSMNHKLHDDIYSANLADTRTDIDSIDGFGGSREAKIANLSYSTNDLALDEQAVENVNGHIARRVGYMALKKMDRGRIEKLNEPLPPDAITRIIASFLKANGYKLSHDNQSVLYFEREDFNAATDLFFDLKGTDWYAHVKSGKISLIAKIPGLFKAEEVKVSKLKENEYLKGLSVLEKINQRCVLNVYTQQRMLNTRFNFNNDKLNIYVKALKPTHKNNPTNYYQMNLRGDFDVIEREILQIQKKQLDETASIIDYTALETLRAQMRRDDRDYDISVARDVLYATEKENEHYRRQKWDLSTQRMQMWMNLGLGLGQGASSMAAGQYLMNYKQSQMTAGKGPNAAAKLESMKHIGSVVSGISAFSAVGGAIKSIANAIVANQIFDERAKRIETDRKFAFKDIAFKSLQIDLRHRDVQEDSIRQLNKLSNVYNRGSINDLDAIEEFNQENALGNINLTVFTPSKEQMKLLVGLKEEYGVDCDIPNAIIHINEGMSEDVIRFNHLSGEGIIGLSNAIERDYLMSILEMGIKVVDTCGNSHMHNRSKREVYACTNIYELTKQIEDHRILSENTGKINADLRDEISKLKNDLNATVHDLEDKKSTIEQLNERLSKCTDHSIVKEKEEECKQRLAEKDAQIELQKGLKKEVEEELTQKLNDERRKFLDEQDKANALSKSLKEKSDELDSFRTQTDEEKKRLQAEVKEWKDKYVNRPKVSWKETPGQCQMFRDMLDDPYAYDLKTRENGWDAFLDLVFAIGEDSKWADLSRINEKLSGIPEMNMVFERLHELQEIQIIQKAIEIVKDRGWGSYKRWIVEGGSKNGSVDAIIKKVNELKDLESPPMLHAVKDTMDELNYLVYIALNALHEKVGSNEDLEFFFAHIYPAQLTDKYKALFGDPNKAIIRKRYVAEGTCNVDGGGATFASLNTFKNQTNLKKKVDSAIERKQDPTVPIANPMRRARFSGVPLSSIPLNEEWMAPIYAFEDGYMSRNLENANYNWGSTKQTKTNSTMKGKGYGITCIQFWKWPYWKNPQTKEWNGTRKCIWFQLRNEHWTGNTGNLGQYGYYIEAQDLKIEDTLNNINYLFKNIDRIIIPDHILNGIKDGSKNLRLSMSHLSSGAYMEQISKIAALTNEPVISSADGETYTVEFGGEDEDNKLFWPQEYIGDLLKCVFILHYFYMDIKHCGNLDSDKFACFNFDTGRFHPSLSANSNLKGQALINAVNAAIGRINDTNISLKLGMLFNFKEERLEVNDDLGEWTKLNKVKSQWAAAYLSLFTWMYHAWNNKTQKFEFCQGRHRHPYYYGYNTNKDIDGAMRLMFRRMAHVKNKG